MKARICPDDFGYCWQREAALGLHGLELVAILEVAVDHGVIGKGPQALSRLQFRRIRG